MIESEPTAQSEATPQCQSGLDNRWTDLFWRTPGRFLGLVAILLFVSFPKVLLGIHTFFYRDYGVLGYPFVFFHRAAIWQGQWPSWNPLSNCGAPFLAQWGTMTLYPFSALYLLLPMPWSLTVFSFLHLGLAALGMYWLVWHWTGNRFAAAVGGLVYVFNGVTFSCLYWPNYIVALGWLPWILFFTGRSWRDGGRWMIGAALAAGLQLLSGVPEIVMFTWLIVAGLWIGQAIPACGRRGVLLGRMGLIVLLAAGLAAAQLLPFFDLLAHSQRDPQFASTKWAMPGWGWANFLVPWFHYFQTFQGTFFQTDQAFLSSYYLGLIVVVLAVWASWKIRRPVVWILSGLLVFSLIMALGDNGWLYTWLRTLFPPLGVARYTVKFTILTAVCATLLAAYAVSWIEKEAVEGRQHLRSLAYTGGAALVAIACILWFAKLNPLPFDQWNVTLRNAMWRIGFFLAACYALRAIYLKETRPYKAALQTGFLVLLAADIATHSVSQLPTLPRGVMEPDMWRQQQASAPPKPGQARVLISREAEEHLLRSQVQDQQLDFIGKRLALWSNLNLLDAIPKVNGSSTLQIREQKEVQDLIYKSTNAISAGLLDFLAVTHETSPDSVVEWTERTNAMPWVTGGQTPVFAEPEQTLQAMAEPGFNPREVVYFTPDTAPALEGVGAADCRISSLQVSLNTLNFTVETDAPSVVVVAQSYYHPWQAALDGQPTSLVRANHAFQAVRVPQGRHEISLRYVDRRFHAGLAISGLSILVCLSLWFRFRKAA